MPCLYINWLNIHFTSVYVTYKQNNGSHLFLSLYLVHFVLFRCKAFTWVINAQQKCEKNYLSIFFFCSIFFVSAVSVAASLSENNVIANTWNCGCNIDIGELAVYLNYLRYYIIFIKICIFLYFRFVPLLKVFHNN